MIISDIWKNFGYNTIIYLAALTGIDPTLYEAAMVDGAGKIKQTIHVTMPGHCTFYRTYDDHVYRQRSECGL